MPKITVHGGPTNGAPEEQTPVEQPADDTFHSLESDGFTPIDAGQAEPGEEEGDEDEELEPLPDDVEADESDDVEGEEQT